MKLWFMLSLLPAIYYPQSTATLSRQQRLTIHFETGAQFSWKTGGLSSAEVFMLTGEKNMAHLATDVRPGGRSLSGDAPYIALGVQGHAEKNPSVSWYVGMSTVQRSFAGTYVSTDSTLSAQVFISPAGDSLIASQVQRWDFSAGMSGRFFHIPVGIRIQPVSGTWKWLQAGLNVAPGLTFAHRVHSHLSSMQGTVITKPSGEQVDRDHSDAREVPAYRRHSRATGSYFSFYATLPVHATFNTSARLQFVLGIEPGYQYIKLANVSEESSFMTRISIGARYRFLPER